MQAEYLQNWGKLGPGLFMEYRYAIYLHFIFNAYPGGKVGQSRYPALNEAYLAVYKNPHKSEKSQIMDVPKIGHFRPLMVPNI